MAERAYLLGDMLSGAAATKEITPAESEGSMPCVAADSSSQRVTAVIRAVLRKPSTENTCDEYVMKDTLAFSLSGFLNVGRWS